MFENSSYLFNIVPTTWGIEFSSATDSLKSEFLEKWNILTYSVTGYMWLFLNLFFRTELVLLRGQNK